MPAIWLHGRVARGEQATLGHVAAGRWTAALNQVMPTARPHGARFHHETGAAG